MWQWVIQFAKHYTWVVQVVIVLVSTGLINLAELIIYRRVVQYFEKTNRIWDDLLLHTAHPPVVFLIWLLGITYAGELVKIGYKVLPILEPTIVFRRIGVIFFVVWFLTRFIKQLAERLVHPSYKKRPLDRTSVDAITKLLLLAVGLIAAIAVLQEFHIQVSGILAFFGGGAIVVGFGARDIVANFFGAWMIYLDRPFSVGDWIASPDKEIEGTVEHIGWRSTRIRTFDKRPLYVPNAIFSTVAIQNPSRMTNRRIKTNVGVRYEDAPKIAAIVHDIQQMLMTHPDIDTRQTCFVRLDTFGESSLNLLVYTFTKTTEWVKFQAVQEDVFLKIIDIIYQKHHASMAFPTRTLHISDSHKT